MNLTDDQLDLIMGMLRFAQSEPKRASEFFNIVYRCGEIPYVRQEDLLEEIDQICETINCAD